MKKTIAVLLADGFEEIEALAPADVWRRLGFEVLLAAVGASGTVTGAHGITVKADARLAEIPTDTLDAVILPGGMPGSKNLRDNERVLALVRAMVAENKITAAICAAPIVLEKAGVLKGIRYTMYPGFEAEMSSRPTGNLTEVCGNIITGKGPGAAFAFAACVAKALGSDAEPMYRDGMFIQG
ncbi:MAG: DJ-1/PfpI family protein [Lentisphaeria bacterium]|nr:DJ-1/PfpI family protein [Lentisphaeria bacterium]